LNKKDSREFKSIPNANSKQIDWKGKVKKPSKKYKESKKGQFLIHLLCPKGINVKYLFLMIEKLTFIAAEYDGKNIIKNGKMSTIRITKKMLKYFFYANTVKIV